MPRAVRQENQTPPAGPGSTLRLVSGKKRFDLGDVLEADTLLRVGDDDEGVNVVVRVPPDDIAIAGSHVIDPDQRAPMKPFGQNASFPSGQVTVLDMTEPGRVLDT